MSLKPPHGGFLFLEANCFVFYSVNSIKKYSSSSMMWFVVRHHVTFCLNMGCYISTDYATYDVSILCFKILFNVLSFFDSPPLSGLCTGLHVNMRIYLEHKTNRDKD